MPSPVALISALPLCVAALGFKSLACYHPIPAWRSRLFGEGSTGKPPITFNPSEGIPSTQMMLPCGKCVGCLMDRARSWAIRCHQEAQCHDQNCFITLTYNDFFVPSSLVPSDIVKFFKRLRKHIHPLKLRYLQCGEYGPLLERPHHHACLFGWRPCDLVPFTTNGDHVVYNSPCLEEIWGMGFVTVSDLTFDAACYTARYVLKKVSESSPTYVAHYCDRHPEYITMSRRPGIGREYYDKYKSDIYNIDQCIINDKLKLKPPKYYDKLYDIENPNRMSDIKLSRVAKHNPEDSTQERLDTRERSQKLKLKKLSRNYENNS